MNLLVDIGNTRLKWAVADELGLHCGTPIPHADINPQHLLQRWQALAPPDKLAIACVGSRKLSECVREVAQMLWPACKIWLAQSEAERLGVRNAYRNPESLGVDRWLAMIAAYQRYRQSLCVVGCGTALTFDKIAGTGQHLGGLITPGLRLMQQSLVAGTENLKFATGDYSMGLADATDAAIANGTLAAACGMIEFALDLTQTEGLCILTGGDAEQIACQLSRAVVIEPDLVLQGLVLMLSEPL